MKSFVGNDVIDMLAAHNRGRAQQSRFLGRVLTESEREWLVLAGDGDRRFALLWAAKEAAYKAAKKRDANLVFAPRRWQVEWDAARMSSVRAASVIIAADTRIAVQWEEGDGWLHCIAFIGAAACRMDGAVGTIDDWAVAGALTVRERDAVMGAESVAVRNLARRLLRRQGFDGIDILRVAHGARRGPPQAVLGHEPLAGVDVSLSHDGRFVAAVVAIDDTRPLRG